VISGGQTGKDGTSVLYYKIYNKAVKINKVLYE